jgi:hypothetical protein
MGQSLNFTETEPWIIQTTINKRYRGEVPLHLADTEVSLSPGRTDLTTCPTAFWDQGRTSFVIIKTGPHRYRGQFFGRDLKTYRTDRQEYVTSPNARWPYSKHRRTTNANALNGAVGDTTGS